MNRILTIQLILLLANVSIAQDVVYRLDTAFTQLVNLDQFDGQILLAEGEKIIYHKAYGHRSDGKAIEKDMALPLMSISKPLSSVAILKLEEEGKLSTDDLVTKWIPGFPAIDVTIRHLLSHTSGLPRFVQDYLNEGDTSRLISNDDVLSKISGKNMGSTSPGEKFRYNDDNFIMIGTIVEKASGVPFEEYMKKSIFDPAGMKSTFDRAARMEGMTNLSIDSENFWNVQGGGSIYSTVGDLFNFTKLLQSGELISEQQLAKSFGPVVLEGGDTSRYGLGWFVSRANGSITEAYHLGSSEGVKSFLMQDFLNNRTLAMIHVNSSIYANDIFFMVNEIWSGNLASLPAKRMRYDIDTRLYDEYEGSYLSGFGLVHITQEKGKLFLRPDPVPGKEELIPESDSTFYFGQQDLFWQFYRNNKGEVIGFGMKGQPENMGKKQ